MEMGSILHYCPGNREPITLSKSEVLKLKSFAGLGSTKQMLDGKEKERKMQPGQRWQGRGWGGLREFSPLRHKAPFPFSVATNPSLPSPFLGNIANITCPVYAGV